MLDVAFVFCPYQPKGRCFNGIYPIPQFDILLTSKSGHTLSFMRVVQKVLSLIGLLSFIPSIF